MHRRQHRQLWLELILYWWLVASYLQHRLGASLFGSHRTRCAALHWDGVGLVLAWCRSGGITVVLLHWLSVRWNCAASMRVSVVRRGVVASRLVARRHCVAALHWVDAVLVLTRCRIWFARQTCATALRIARHSQRRHSQRRHSQHHTSRWFASRWFASRHRLRSIGVAASASRQRLRSIGFAAPASQHRLRSIGFAALASQHWLRSIGFAASASQHRLRSIGFAALPSQHRRRSITLVRRGIGVAASESQHRSRTLWYVSVAS